MGAANLGRKPKPRALKVVEDNPGHRPIEPEVPFTRGSPVKPEDLSEDASKLWDLVVEQMQSVGLLKPLDAPSLEILCETYARWKEAARMRRKDSILADNSQGRVSAPWVGIEERAGKEFRAWCSEYGLTPAAERNLVPDAEKDEADNPFA